MVEENNCQKELVETAKQAIQEVAKINGLSYQEAWNRKINELRMFSAPEEQFMPVYKEALRILEEEGSNNDHEGKAWPFLRKTLQKQIKNKEAVKTIDRESGEILNLLVNLNEKGVKRKGLVVGYVQSGKTANFSAVITKAVDEGSRLVILMTFGTLSFLVTTPECWVPDLGSGEHGFPLLSGAGRLVIKDTAILAGALVVLSDCAQRILKRK